MTDIEQIIISKLSKIEGAMDEVREDITSIKIQTTKTNGRVNRLEEKVEIIEDCNTVNKTKIIIFDVIKMLASAIVGALTFFITIKKNM